MKKAFYFVVCLLAMVSFFASCGEKDNKEETNNNNTTENDDYVKKFVGNWMIDGLKINGESIQVPGEILIVMNDNGTGYVSDNGETENNDFTWSVKGDQLTIVQRHGELIFTIKNLTSTECTFAGRTFPGQEGDMGDVEIHITKVR